MIPLIPRELLFGNPERVSPRLSPDGRRMAYLAPDEGVLNVWVRTVGEEDDRPVTRDRGRGIQMCEWAEDNVHLLYVQDRDGDENWHLYRVTDAGGDDVDLTPIDGVQARIIAVEKGHPGTILIGLNDREPQLHDVYRLEIATGERELVVENEVGAIDFTADHDLNVRLAHLPTPDGGFQVLHRASPDDDWAPLLAIPAEDALSTSPIGFLADNRTLLLVSSIGANAARLVTLDVMSGQETTIAEDPAYDVSDVLRDPESFEPLAVSFVRERSTWKVLDDSVRADFEGLEKLQHGDFDVVSRSHAGDAWLVAHSQDRGPVVYHAWDRGSRTGTFLFSARPKLEDRPLVEMRPISYRSRDGLTIHGYLTLPPGKEHRNLPAVVNVHGGPWHRDTWGYNGEAQWLANRGYACLQINFRGSTGYGKDFLNAGDREWGGKMQDDVTDGARWLVEQGWADPKRIGIYGGSYGGFAVLSGLTKTPELYRCGVDIVGPSNLISFIQTVPPYWEPVKAIFRERVGDIETEKEFLESRSPLFMVDRIRAPLLIVQGKHDPRVNREESLQIRDALHAAGKTVEFLEFEDEGHGFARPENRLAFYARAEEFLAEHLGGRFEPVA